MWKFHTKIPLETERAQFSSCTKTIQILITGRCCVLRVCSQTWGKVQYWHFYWKFNEFNSGLASIRCKARINGSNRIPINLDSLYQDSYNIFLEFKLFIHWFDKSNELCLHVSLLLPFHGGECTASHTRSFKPEENFWYTLKRRLAEPKTLYKCSEKNTNLTSVRITSDFLVGQLEV